jgi:hypothetical protein
MIGRLFNSRAHLLPRDGGGEAWLGGLIAVLCFLACLSAAGAVSADRAAHGWARALRSEATIQVRPRVGETGAEAAARAAQTLAGVEGVSEAEAMDRETAEALLRPWVGDAVLPDLPVPHLVTVRLDPIAPASAVTLGRALADASRSAVEARAAATEADRARGTLDDLVRRWGENRLDDASGQALGQALEPLQPPVRGRPGHLEEPGQSRTAIVRPRVQVDGQDSPLVLEDDLSDRGVVWLGEVGELSAGQRDARHRRLLAGDRPAG